MVLGLVPKIGEVVAAMPEAGGRRGRLVLFATVAVVGDHHAAQGGSERPDQHHHRGGAVGIGLLPEFTQGMFEQVQPTSAQILLDSGVTLGAHSAFSLNLLFNHTRIGAIARAASAPVIAADPVPPTSEEPHVAARA